jgi:cyclopropane fatty-acyl-phospholipid synthase-like methyltransferase
VNGRQGLDIGCGTGKQLFRLAPLVSVSGGLLGIDLSENAVNEVNARAAREHLPWVEAQQMHIDESISKLSGRWFDFIVSTYAIYYSKNIVTLLQGLKSLLSEQGVVFICGPGRDTNIEMVNLVNGFIPGSGESLMPIDDFMTPDQIREVAGSYASFDVFRLENQIVLDSARDVMQWWENHNSYVSSVASNVEGAIDKHFATNKTFSLTKNVLGIRFHA